MLSSNRDASHDIPLLECMDYVFFCGFPSDRQGLKCWPRISSLRDQLLGRCQRLPFWKPLEARPSLNDVQTHTKWVSKFLGTRCIRSEISWWNVSYDVHFSYGIIRTGSQRQDLLWRIEFALKTILLFPFFKKDIGAISPFLKGTKGLFLAQTPVVPCLQDTGTKESHIRPTVPPDCQASISRAPFQISTQNSTTFAWIHSNQAECGWQRGAMAPTQLQAQTLCSTRQQARRRFVASKGLSWE